MSEPTPPRRNPFAGASAGYLPVGGAVVGFGGGWLVDRAAGTLPVWTLILGTLFLAVGMYHMIREARPMSVLLVAIAVGLVVAFAASQISSRTVSGSLGLCLAGQFAALLVRLIGLLGVAVLVHFRWPEDLLAALAAAAVVILTGLVLDVRSLRRILRVPAEERVRA